MYKSMQLIINLAVVVDLELTWNLEVVPLISFLFFCYGCNERFLFAHSTNVNSLVEL